ncbi:hypothetical protein MPSI1_002475 [Malassezia psittaci]|uniref:Vacuolar protein sorting-associated protein 54 C-terminal domain-containing protein n=1 Tax=Malassezia psittaci TaxID=1821823 RepID=A0AAF0F7H5_9BASI|nr:hypothetical protein MPSI1_002475 [Malassezia psittaci]
MLNHPQRRPAPIESSAAKFAPIGPSRALADLAQADTAVLENYLETYTAIYERYDREHSQVDNSNSVEEGNVSRLPPLSTVPQVFFGNDFDINKQYTYDLVTEKYKQNSAAGIDADQALSYGVVLNQMLQEKLSYYSDVIEQHLVVEISARSCSFFDAFGILQNLAKETTTCIAQIDALHSHLDHVNQQVVDGLQLESLRRDRDQLAQQEAMLHDLRRILERRDLLLLLVQHDELENALAVLQELEPEVQNAQAPEAAQALLPQIKEAKSNIAVALEAALTQLVNETLQNLPQINLDMAFDENLVVDTLLPDQEPVTPEDWPEVARLLGLLNRCGALSTSLTQYTEQSSIRLERVVTASLEHNKRTAWISELIMEGSEGKQRVQSLAWSEYISVCAAMFRVLLIGARNCTALDVALQKETSTLSETHKLIDQAMQNTWNRVQRIATEVFTARTSKLMDQTLDDSVPYFALLWRFVALVEQANDRAVVSLRSAVLSQTKTFLVHVHRTRIEKAMRAVEEEVWAPAPVPGDLAQTVMRIWESSSHDPPSLVIDTVLHASSSPAPPPKSEDTKRTLEINGKPYFVVRANGVVLNFLSDYVRMLINLPMFTAETLGWIVEFMKQYNSRTCQVVLGAGAMRSAGLKNITARHLALASQSLSLMVLLIAPLRALCERHLKSSQSILLTEFDKLQRDFTEHQNEIHAKLVAIMSDRIQVHAKALSNSNDWNAPFLEDETPASHPVQDLVRETGTLHRVMTQYLDMDAIQNILSKVCQAMDSSLSSSLSRVDVKSIEAHKRMQKDVDYIASKMQALHQNAWKGDQLAEVLKNKVPPPAPTPAAARASMEKSSGSATPPLAYRPRFSMGKRPPATQSPRLNALDAFENDKDPKISTKEENLQRSPKKSAAKTSEEKSRASTSEPQKPTNEKSESESDLKSKAAVERTNAEIQPAPSTTQTALESVPPMKDQLPASLESNKESAQVSNDSIVSAQHDQANEDPKLKDGISSGPNAVPKAEPKADSGSTKVSDEPADPVATKDTQQDKQPAELSQGVENVQIEAVPSADTETDTSHKNSECDDQPPPPVPEKPAKNHDSARTPADQLVKSSSVQEPLTSKPESRSSAEHTMQNHAEEHPDSAVSTSVQEPSQESPISGTSNKVASQSSISTEAESNANLPSPQKPSQESAELPSTPQKTEDLHDTSRQRTKNRSAGRVALQQRLAESMRRRAAKPKNAGGSGSSAPENRNQSPTKTPQSFTAEEVGDVQLKDNQLEVNTETESGIQSQSTEGHDRNSAVETAEDAVKTTNDQVIGLPENKLDDKPVSNSILESIKDDTQVVDKVQTTEQADAEQLPDSTDATISTNGLSTKSTDGSLDRNEQSALDAISANDASIESDIIKGPVDLQQKTILEKQDEQEKLLASEDQHKQKELITLEKQDKQEELVPLENQDKQEELILPEGRDKQEELISLENREDVTSLEKQEERRQDEKEEQEEQEENNNQQSKYNQANATESQAESQQVDTGVI